jgi:GNAT superfamily N-acetyltransferase
MYGTKMHAPKVVPSAMPCHASSLENQGPRMTDTLPIHQASLDDLDALTPLFDAYRCFYKQPPDVHCAHDFLQERLSLRESVIFLATENGQGLGFTQLYPCFSSVAARRLWILNDLFVTPDARGRGIGRTLLERARRHAEQTGALRVTLSTGQDNHRAQRLYEALGYQPDPDRHYELGIE